MEDHLDAEIAKLMQRKIEIGRTYSNKKAIDILELSPTELNGKRFDAPEFLIYDMDDKKLANDEYPFRYVMNTGKSINNLSLKIKFLDGREKIIVINQ
jgi:hypothetical protein